MGARIIVYEDTAPNIKLRLKKRVPGGGTLPYTLDGSPTISFDVKVNPDDAAALFSYTGGAIAIISDGTALGATYSEIGVQFSAADLDTPRTLRWHLTVTKSGNPDVVDDGFLVIKNI